MNNEQEEAKRMQETINNRQQMMEKYGWVVDFVFDGEKTKCGTGTGRDVHTHGLLENFDHTDLQIILPLDSNTAHSILYTAVERIKKGEKFHAGGLYSDILGGGYKVTFIDAKQGDRDVLRMILPDKDGNLEKNEIEDDFLEQYNMVACDGHDEA